MPISSAPVISTPSTAWTSAPIYKGATDNPTATYSTQQGYYVQIGNMVWVSIYLITSTMSKTTTTDPVLISLPFAMVNNTNERAMLTGYTSNGTPVQNGTGLLITAGNQYGTVTQVPLVAAVANLTYGTLSLGVLTNTITSSYHGWYAIG